VGLRKGGQSIERERGTEEEMPRRGCTHRLREGGKGDVGRRLHVCCARLQHPLHIHHDTCPLFAPMLTARPSGS
jgi:hypothetical protein